MSSDTVMANTAPAPLKSGLLRSALAVLAGITTLTITSFAIEAVLNPLLVRWFALPNEAAISTDLRAWPLTMAYSLACVAAGGYVTAWIARRAPVKHALIMGAIQIVLTIMAWMSYPAMAPARNWIIGMALMLPATWIGGRLRASRG